MASTQVGMFKHADDLEMLNFFLLEEKEVLDAMIAEARLCARRYMSLLPRLRPLGNSDERQALMNDLALPENLYALITSFCCEWHEP